MLTITIPIPEECTHPNHIRGRSWRVVNAAKRRQRNDAHLSAIFALDVASMDAPEWVLVTIDVEYHCNGMRAQQHDEDNIIGWLKSSVDGLQDARIISNDQGVKWGSIKQFLRDEAKERKIVLTITPRV